MMPVRGEEDKPQRALIEADEILDQLGFKSEPVPAQSTHLSSQRIKRHLRKYLVQMRGPGWFRATFTEHTLPDGQRAFTAARKCPRCGEIETFIVAISDDGELQFACPLEDE